METPLILSLLPSFKKITDIVTPVGNSMLERMKNDGWRVVNEYDQFDKGIDYDSYWLQKGIRLVFFEWTNWEEWTIKGPESVIESLRSDYLSKGSTPE